LRGLLHRARGRPPAMPRRPRRWPAALEGNGRASGAIAAGACVDGGHAGCMGRSPRGDPRRCGRAPADDGARRAPSEWKTFAPLLPIKAVTRPFAQASVGSLDLRDRGLYCEGLKNGEMSEWLKEHAWKACVGETLPRVRIPLSPPPNRPFSMSPLSRTSGPGSSPRRVWDASE